MLPRRLAATAVVIAFCGACAPTSRWGEPVAVVPTRAANPLVHPGTLRGVWGGGECTESISDSYEVEITQATICVSRVECVVDFSGAPSGPLAAPREERVTLGVEHDYRVVTLRPLSPEETGRGCDVAAPRENGSRTIRSTSRGCTENAGLVTPRSNALNLYLGDHPAKELRVVAWTFSSR